MLSFGNDNEHDMSRNYSASQYEKSFTPKRLQMYQVPKDPQPGVVSTADETCVGRLTKFAFVAASGAVGVDAWQ